MRHSPHDDSSRAGAVSRRSCLASLAVGGLFTLVPRHVLGGPGQTAPSDKLNIAGVGLGAMGLTNLENCSGERIVAVCDVDLKLAKVAFEQFPEAKRFQDYREMLDAPLDVDAVVVATPDHTHATVTAEAMRRGKHVYTQMPLASNVDEVRMLTRLARETGVTTQMGNVRHSGPDIRSVCEWVWAGVLGEVARVDCWTNRPQWPQGMARPNTSPPVPESLDWEGWIGPAPMRAYHPAYHPYLWRGWRDFGTGALGAMGCHLLDAPFWALRLDEADHFTVEADADGLTEECWPRASTIRFQFPARRDMPPVTITWNDGGRRPEVPRDWPAAREHVGSNGTFFHGEESTMAFGALTAGTSDGQSGPRLIPDLEGPVVQRVLPRVGDGRSVDRHEREWIAACKQGRQPCSNFAVAGPLAEMALVGNLALQSDAPIRWERSR